MVISERRSNFSVWIRVVPKCAMLRKATKGIGASANVIWRIVCGRTAQEMEILKKAYIAMYDTDLGKLLASEFHGDMGRLRVSSKFYAPLHRNIHKISTWSMPTCTDTRFPRPWKRSLVA